MREQDIHQVHARATEGMDAAMQTEIATFQQARLSGDLDAMAASVQRLGGMKATQAFINSMAAEELNRRAAPMAGTEDLNRGDAALCQKFGIGANELGIAKNWTSDPNMTDAQKVETYLHNRARYQHARATGAYRDDQGTVRR